MKKLLSALALAAMALPGLAFAGAGGASCADAQQLLPNHDYSGDTSLNTNFIGGFGGVPSPGPDSAYYFVSNGLATDSIVVNVVGGWNAAIVVTASPCNGNAGNPVLAATGTTTIDLPLGTLTAGQTYYVYITGNPTDNSGPSGAYGFHTPDPLPVALQNFSID
jgi:hypothetical protein